MRAIWASSRRWSTAEASAARALRAMGDPEGMAIIERYAEDERLPVRRYARSLLGGGATANREVGN